MSPSKLRQAPE